MSTQPQPRQSRPTSRHRADVRPRYGRIAVLLVSLATTAVALLGGVGVISASASGRDDASDSRAVDDAAAPVATGPSLDTAPRAAVPSDDASDEASDEPSQDTSQDVSESPAEEPAEEPALPAGSGSGRRVVFSQSEQRVWIVDHGSDDVTRTYLVSGSLTDNLDPGTYEVYSRSMNAIGVDDSGTMTHFVRFTQGPSGAAIGFHDIPVLDGKRIQSKKQLGTPRSHGCIRQAEKDAKAMWAFAQMGTKVVVTA